MAIRPPGAHVPAQQLAAVAAGTPETSRPRWPVPGDWPLVAVAVVGAVLGSLLHAGWLHLVLGAAVLAAVVALGCLLVPGVARRLPARWPESVRDLVRIWCAGCGRDLDRASPEFARRHPAPLCVICQVRVSQGVQQRPAVVGAVPEGETK